MDILDYKISYSREIADLFYNSIHNINTAIYSQEQLDAWAPTPIDYEHWSARLELKKPFVAVKENTVLGFIELESDGHIDCLYVHPDHQRKGVAAKLLLHLCDAAVQQNIAELHLEASKLAKPFFESFGFTVVGENRVQIKNQTLSNYKMIGDPRSIG